MSSRENYTYVDGLDLTQYGVDPFTRPAPNDRNPVEINRQGQPIAPQPPTMSMKSAFAPNIKPQSCTPVTDLLLPETSTMIYTDEFFKQPDSRLFLQNVQPNIYSYSVDLTPINSNLGISYTPQVPPKFRDQVYNAPENATYPIYTRVDPQLIRDDGVPARLMEQPMRNDWSAQYSSYNAAPGSINVEDIYDPRFTGYSAGQYRSYQDVNLGQVAYNYSDVDAYKFPNYITRAKTDFIEFKTPMGQIRPYYVREASLDDVRPYVENQWTQDSMYFRENLMEEQMRGANARRWQYRYAPLSSAANSRYKTSGA